MNVSRKAGIGLAILTLLLSAIAAPGQRKFYIAPDDHTDYYWTADEARYRQAFLSMLDYYLDKMDATQSNPSDQQMRWNCDGSLWMWEFEKNRTPQQFERFISRVRDGHMSVPLNALVLAQGGSATESVLRGMYYSGLIERRHNVRFPMAISMENQTLPYGLPSLWAGAGAKYSWKGVCKCANQTQDLENREREIYYHGGRDGSRVLMKWNSVFTTNQGFGGYAEAFNPMQSINFAETNSNFQNRYPFPIIGVFGSGYDDIEYKTDEFVTVAKNNSNANRRIIVSNQEDFFKDFEANHGPSLETHAAAYGNEWDTYIASLSEVSARVKRATEKLRSAEAMAALVSANNPQFMASRVAERDRAMLNMGLYYEHDWTADGDITREVRGQWSRDVEGKITKYVDKLYEDAKAELGRQIARDAKNDAFYVFNPLGWARTDFADIPVSNRKFKAVDVSTGLDVPSQIIRVGDTSVLRILASNIPSAGYKVFELRPGPPADFPPAATVAGQTIENSSYRVTLANDGAITSLIDKTRGNRQLVRNIDGLVLNDLGGNRSGSITVENAGPVSVTLKATSSSPVGHTTRLTLYRDSGRIDIENEITQNFGSEQTWAYSFNINSPDVWHEEVGAVIRAKLLANGGHYSPRNARYDWMTMNHFADITESVTGNFGVTLSNWDNQFMQYGPSAVTLLNSTIPQLKVLAGGQVDGPDFGIPNQGGDRHFLQRFALSTHGAFSQTNAMKVSLEHQNPFVTGVVDNVGTQTRHYPATSFSFLSISNPNVLLWTLKPAEDGVSRGIVARVWNQGNNPTTYNLSLSRPITAAERVTHIETSIGPATITSGQLTAAINQQQIQTHLLKTGSNFQRTNRLKQDLPTR